MTDDEKIIEENWASDAWEARVKGQSDGNLPPDEELFCRSAGLTEDVFDAGQKSRQDDTDCQADTERLAEEEIQSHDVPLPPPTLVTLASGLAAQAMVSLGVFPNPATGKGVLLLNQATHLIDMIDLLYEKTTGNRSDEETRTLENMLHELRMIYLAAQKAKRK